MAERLAELEERLSTQEYINIDLETRLIVQERKNEEHEDIIKALSARTCITSKHTTLERQQDAMLHKNRVNRKSSVDREKTDSKSSVATTFGKATVSKKDVNEQFKIGHGLHDANISIKDVQNIDCERVAFYSYLSNTDMHPKPNQTIVFDHVVTNIGGKFNSKTGVFSCPLQGVYAFSWTVYCSNGGYLISELVVNSQSVGDMLCSGQGDDNIRHTSSVAVVELNKSDRVFVRTHPKAVLNGVLWSGPTYFSSFSGWTIT